MTPLSLSVYAGAAMNATTFIAHGAELESRDCRGYTALMLAIENNYSYTVGLLLRSSARTDCITAGGANIVHLAAAWGGIDVMKRLAEANIRDIDPYDTGVFGISPQSVFERRRDSYFGIINDRNPQEETIAFRVLLDSMTQSRIQELPSSAMSSNSNVPDTLTEAVDNGETNTRDQEVDEESIEEVFYNAEEG
jgi:hypothetical protein